MSLHRNLLFVSLLTAAAAAAGCKDGSVLERTSAAATSDNAPQGMQAPAPGAPTAPPGAAPVAPGSPPPAPGAPAAPIDTANPNSPTANPNGKGSGAGPGSGSGSGVGSGSGSGSGTRIPGDAGVPMPSRDAGGVPGDAR